MRFTIVIALTLALGGCENPFKGMFKGLGNVGAIEAPASEG